MIQDVKGVGDITGLLRLFAGRLCTCFTVFMDGSGTATGRARGMLFRHAALMAVCIDWREELQQQDSESIALSKLLKQQQQQQVP